MDTALTRISTKARKAVEAGDWATVSACALEIIKRDRNEPEGHFLHGLTEKAMRRSPQAAAAFATVLHLDARRYDAAIELAALHLTAQRYAEALRLLKQYAPSLSNSPRYLDLAGSCYTRMGLHEQAWAAHTKANALQPNVPVLQENLAASAVYVGRMAEAKALYHALLERFPTHQRNHYELSRLERARDAQHVEQMEALLHATKLPPEKNIFLYYALGKELEDLERWDESFQYYQRAGDAVTKVARYDVAADEALLAKIVAVCDGPWLADGAVTTSDANAKRPIFVVGLPRTGTTLTERILSSHSQVESMGETQFLQMVLRRESGVESPEAMSPATIEAVAARDIRQVARGYLAAAGYRLGARPVFVDKLPENYQYLGFIAKAYPRGGIVHLRRHPLDACFAMYKQSFFRFAYTLENVGRYYIAYDRLLRHWRAVLGERLVEVEYEALVANQERETRRLLECLELPFEAACLEFAANPSAIATASSAQVREPMHTRSVGRWRHYAQQLQPLVRMLEAAGIALD